jgi:hypothetical protein
LRKVCLLAGASAIAIAIVARATPPGLSITALGGGDYQLTITNAVPGHTYEIYSTPSFDWGYLWNVDQQGASGQTNFTISARPWPSGFFIALDGDDLDSDGIPNWEDANPTNAAIGIMTVIIDTPTNRYTFK